MRALVVVCRYLGDTLLATPLAQSLAAAGYEVDWLVAPGNAPLLEHQPFARRVITLHPSLTGARAALRELRQPDGKRYEIACVVNGSDRPMAVTLLAAKQVYALVPERWQDGWKRLLATGCITNNPDDHMVCYAFDLARLAQLPEVRSVTLGWNDRDAAAVAAALNWPAGTHYLHLHPFARFPYKLWPNEQWQALIGRLLDAGLNLAMTGAPHEQAVLEQLVAPFAEARQSGRIRLLAGQLGWAQLACLSHGSVAYIGMDTANTHLAASSGAPVIALFGPTDPRRWGPWPNGFAGRQPWLAHAGSGVQRVGNIRLLQGNRSCVPCQLEGCDRRQQSRSQCLDTLPVEQVWAEIAPLLAAA